MSSAVVSTSAALGRLFHFDADPDPHMGIATQTCPEPVERDRPVERTSAAIQQHLQSSINSKKIPPASITPASRLEIRPAPQMASSGIAAIDALTGGLPRGCLTEIFGPASSGRTSVLMAALAAATGRGEYCAVVDASDALDPHSVAAAGVDLDRLLWVRCGEESPQSSRSKQTGCPILAASFAARVGIYSQAGCPTLRDFRRVGVSEQAAFSFARVPQKKIEATENPRQSEHRLEQVLRATDLLLESGGFGLIILDLSDLAPQAARRIPLTTWFRFRRAVEHKPTILLSIEQHPIAGSCSSLLLQLGAQENGVPTFAAQDNYFFDADEAAAKRRKNAAHGASHGLGERNEQSPEGRKKITDDESVPAHAQLLTGLHIHAELVHSRMDRKPSQSIAFSTKTAWAG
jgi:recombination protein RecA